MKNKKEFIELIERYETITFAEIKKEWSIGIVRVYSMGFEIAQSLTGYGSLRTCTLCQALEKPCYDCVYGNSYGCIIGENEKTYNDIHSATTPMKLKNAFRKRAKYLKETYKHILDEQNIRTD